MNRTLLKALKSTLLFLQFFISTPTLAKDITVFDVRRPVSLENGQELPKDFFINAGVEAGIKVGMVVTVNRRQTLYDPFQSKSPGDLVVPVGQLRVIHVQENLSVARLVEVMGREMLPTLEYDAVMVGDRLDMSTAKMGKSLRASNEAKSEAVFAVATEVVAAESVATEADESRSAASAPSSSTTVASSVSTAATPMATPSSHLANSTPQPQASVAKPPSPESSSQLQASSVASQGPTL